METPGQTPETKAPARKGARIAHAIGHALKWLCAIVGTFIAVLIIQIVASALLSRGIAAIENPELVPSPLYELLFGDLSGSFKSLCVQFIWLFVVVLWWLHVHKRGIGPSGAQPASNAGAWARRVGAIVLLGLGLQVVVDVVLTFLLPLFPAVEAAYDETMESVGIGSPIVIDVISLVIAAPLVEETTFRGIMFQFALRAVSPTWSKKTIASAHGRLHVGAAQFWVANVVQAAAFGIMHFNITQGLYAFAFGLVLGWVFWRTGKLRWCIGLHAAFNAAGYAAEPLLVGLDALGLFGWVLGFAVFATLAIAAAWLFAYETSSARDADAETAAPARTL